MVEEEEEEGRRTCEEEGNVNHANEDTDKN